VYLSATSAYVSVSHASSASALARCSVRAVPSHGASALLCSDCSRVGNNSNLANNQHESGLHSSTQYYTVHLLLDIHLHYIHNQGL
jgi:hypothetical protein